jgi:probable addiction module antidote protein
MPKRTRDHHEWLLKQLNDPQVAAEYLNEAMSDSPELALKALRNVAEAKKMAKVAEEAGINRESLYRTLSGGGNPTWETLNAILDAVHIRLKFESDTPMASATSVQQKESEATAVRTKGSITCTCTFSTNYFVEGSHSVSRMIPTTPHNNVPIFLLTPRSGNTMPRGED